MFNLSLGFKIIAFVIVIFVIFAYLNFRAEKGQMIEQSKRTAELLSIAIYSSLEEAMLEGKTEKVQKMIEKLGGVEEIEKIRIFNSKDNKILVDADKAKIDSVANQRDPSLLEELENGNSRSKLFTEDGKPVLSTIIPIMNGPKCHQCHPQENVLGVLDIDMSVTSMFADIARSRFRMIRFLLLTAIIASLMIMLLIIYFVNRPIKGLTDAMSKVESGDLTAEAYIPRYSDLGKLGKSLNSMTAKLRSDIEKLEILHEAAQSLRSTMDQEEIERVTIQGITRVGFERAVLLLVNEEEQILEGRTAIGVAEDIVRRTRIPLDREYGILAESVLDARPFNVQGGLHDISLTPEKLVMCWESHECDKEDCPAYHSDDLRCWLHSRTYCHDDVQSNLEDKTLVCCECPVIHEAYGNKAVRALLMFGSKAFATVPLMAQNKVTGVIVVDNLHSGRSITDEDIKRLSIFAAQAGIAIENVKLYKQLESRIEAADEELRQKIAALTEIRNLNDSILQNMSNGLITTDIDGNIVYFNSAAEAILGYEAQEVQGQPMKDLFSNLESLASETLREDRSFAFHEITVHRKTDAEIPIAVSTSLLKDDDGGATGVIVILTDLAERREMETQIRRADKLATLGQLAAGIAHEIRNPLAGISGAVQILRDDVSRNDQEKEILGDIVDRIDKLNTTISNFLRFARPAPLQLSPVDINEVVQSVLFLMNKQAETQKISIIADIEQMLVRENLISS